MTALLVQALWLAAASPAADLPPPVALVPFACGEVTAAAVRPALAVELHARLLDETAPLSSGTVTVSVSCRGSDVILAVASPGRVGPPLRSVPLAGVAGTASASARARAVALAIAELVRDRPAPDAPPPTVTEAAPPRPDEERGVHGEVLIGPVLGAFASRPGTPVAGAHVRNAFFLGKVGARTTAPWWFGSMVDFNFSAASFWNGGGDLTLVSGALGLLAERPAKRWVPALATGTRFGAAKFTSLVGPTLAGQAWFTSAFAEVAVKLDLGRITLRLGAEIDFPLVAPARFCSRECVEFSGPSLITALDVAVPL